jgi:N-acetylglutamate synthase-like GNAT family acetyltransferase
MIRKANPADIDGILHVLGMYDFTVLPEKSGATIDQRFPGKFLLSNNVSEFVWDRSFVAEEDGAIVGFCHYTTIDDQTAKTRLLTVLPSHRGTGLGKQLHIARMKAAYDNGIVKLHTESEHPKSIQWYKKHFGCIEDGTVESVHGLVFFHLPDRIIWGIHYGFKDYPIHKKLVCDLPLYFTNHTDQ